ncbi:T9SS C-terminal target domain-containing protein [Chryseobacterium nematophagum]|uniref:T9SS C-terminal target domain-containing protein n=1 Tax=Chryseobacterium nematophagum TaxID=2305228 RepID=A0A3M7TIC4_9FLAO|nr:zinc-dependent metalloprotease family protein [Chryseobacterium nematophagum]RNA62844.1 T9SS C-terminal target domain-containing protein [Chryseobacterium nematophagum]
MKQIITLLMCGFLGGNLFSQWTAINSQGFFNKPPDKKAYYKLDFDLMCSLLKNAQETGKNAKAIEISLPTVEGKIERFAVYSFPVVVKELAVQYQLGSYVGVGIDDPSKYVRFSVAPHDFQSMMFKNGESEFIETQTQDKTIYVVYTGSKGNTDFACGVDENSISVKQLEQLREQGKTFSHQPTDFSKSPDQKFRTMRLALSTTGDYMAFHGGTVSGALAGINATMTRVNGILEKDLALHLDVQNFPTLIYTDSATDPYSTDGADNNVWNLELQNVLATTIGNANYDIGHLLVGHQDSTSGFAGNAGCIGCICLDPVNTFSIGKGSAFSSSDVPQGDYFDVTIVAHEFGHQLGATHTFSDHLEGAGTNVEPGFGFTIMSYGGSNIGPYYHYASMRQMMTNLINTTCDVELPISNNPPVIAPLPISYMIPKGTAFVLSASVTDPEGDPMSYTWDEMDNAESPVTDVTGNNTTGGLFRSLLPGNSPIRYFPKLSSVLDGNLTIPSDWETVSNVSRLMNFSLTVRDNHPIANQQQTQTTTQFVLVRDDGPFKINTIQVDPSAPSLIEWDVVNTNGAPYNVANVKIDYTTDNGSNWTILAASTPNDGTESLSFPISLNNQAIKLRVSAIDNVFYAVQKIIITNGVCSTVIPANVAVETITLSSAMIGWDSIPNATYQIRYKKSVDISWSQTTSVTNTVILNDLEGNTQYDVQVATVCSSTPGAFSNTVNFTTSDYCFASSLGNPNDYISNVTLANIDNSSGASSYTNYTTDPSKQINLTKGSTYHLSVTKSWLNTPPRANMVSAWIDFNNNGLFEDIEAVMLAPNELNPNPVTANFIVSSNAILNKPLRMRVVLMYPSLGGPIDIPYPCGPIDVGEVENYTVVIGDLLSINNVEESQDRIQLYPNPVSDVLWITHVSDRAVYKVYNTVGQLMMTDSMTGSQINVSELATGEYMITIEEKGQHIIKSKFLKK